MNRWLFFMMVLGVFPTAWAAEVSVAPDRMLLVDGKRTFVIGLYENPGDDAVFDEVVRAGFNLIRSGEDKAALDRLHSRGVYAWVDTGGRIELGSNPDHEKQLRDMVTGCGSHPALLVWEVVDEPLWTCTLNALKVPGTWSDKVADFNKNAPAMAASMTAGYQLLRQLDPRHPVWINHAAGGSVSMLAAFNQGADIVGCDMYPLMPYPTWPIDISRSVLAAVGTCTTRMQLAAPSKSVWMVLQGMSWGDVNEVFTHKPQPGQWPTFEESRFMAYDSIVRGARAVLYWGTHCIPKDGPFWKSLMKVARELADNQALLCAADSPITPKIETKLFGVIPFEIKGCPIGVQALGKVVDGQTWWIVVNEFPVTLSYSLGGLTKLEGKGYTESGSGENSSVKNGSLSHAISRYGVQILKPVPEHP